MNAQDRGDWGYEPQAEPFDESETTFAQHTNTLTEGQHTSQGLDISFGPVPYVSLSTCPFLNGEVTYDSRQHGLLCCLCGQNLHAFGECRNPPLSGPEQEVLSIIITNDFKRNNLLPDRPAPATIETLRGAASPLQQRATSAIAHGKATGRSIHTPSVLQSYLPPTRDVVHRGGQYLAQTNCPTTTQDLDMEGLVHTAGRQGRSNQVQPRAHPEPHVAAVSERGRLQTHHQRPGIPEVYVESTGSKRKQKLPLRQDAAGVSPPGPARTPRQHIQVHQDNVLTPPTTNDDRSVSASRARTPGVQVTETEFLKIIAWRTAEEINPQLCDRYGHAEAGKFDGPFLSELRDALPRERSESRPSASQLTPTSRTRSSTLQSSAPRTPASCSEPAEDDEDGIELDLDIENEGCAFYTNAQLKALAEACEQLQQVDKPCGRVVRSTDGAAGKRKPKKLLCPMAGCPARFNIKGHWDRHIAQHVVKEAWLCPFCFDNTNGRAIKIELRGDRLKDHFFNHHYRHIDDEHQREEVCVAEAKKYRPYVPPFFDFCKDCGEHFHKRKEWLDHLHDDFVNSEDPEEYKKKWINVYPPPWPTSFRRPGRSDCQDPKALPSRDEHEDYSDPDSGQPGPSQRRTATKRGKDKLGKQSAARDGKRSRTDGARQCSNNASQASHEGSQAKRPQFLGPEDARDYELNLALSSREPDRSHNPIDSACQVVAGLEADRLMIGSWIIEEKQLHSLNQCPPKSRNHQDRKKDDDLLSCYIDSKWSWSSSSDDSELHISDSRECLQEAGLVRPPSYSYQSPSKTQRSGNPQPQGKFGNLIQLLHSRQTSQKQAVMPDMPQCLKIMEELVGTNRSPRSKRRTPAVFGVKLPVAAKLIRSY